MSTDREIMDAVGQFYADPLGYVMFAFPWNTEKSIQLVELPQKYRERFNCQYGPDQWACEFLDDLGEEIKKRGFDGTKSVSSIRYSTASGHGIGKSTLVAWLIMFLLDTRPEAKGVVTANTAEQLRTKTWAELAKWHSLAITNKFWKYSSSRGDMALSRVGGDNIGKRWRCDAQTCREENSEAFQGLHAASSTPFYIFDEASGIPEKIWEARFGGATDGEPMSFDFGNPTRKSGYFYENCVGEYKHRYKVRCIDSRSVQITNKALIEEWRHDWGEDSDLFKVKVRGVFPSAGSVQFISTDVVEEAMVRPAASTPYDPLIIGVDVARFGENNTIIYPRIGNDAASFPYKEYNGLDVTQVVEKVIETLQEFQRLGRKCNGLFIDGGGLGGGVVDLLRRLGYNPIDVNFGNKASSQKYRFRGDQMWGDLRDALPYLSLPKDAKLKKHLTQREYGYSLAGNKIQLESKRDMKLRGVESPDVADALALTYASTTAANIDVALSHMSSQQVMHEYDPLQETVHGWK